MFQHFFIFMQPYYTPPQPVSQPEKTSSRHWNWRALARFPAVSIWFVTMPSPSLPTECLTQV